MLQDVVKTFEYILTLQVCFLLGKIVEQEQLFYAKNICNTKGCYGVFLKF